MGELLDLLAEGRVGSLPDSRRTVAGAAGNRDQDVFEAVFAYVLEHLERHGIKVGKGTIVDASIISAPPSTKNKDRARDPEMHQTKKGNQWYFGMKAHIGVDSRAKVIHAVAATAANVHDATCLGQLLHGELPAQSGLRGYVAPWYGEARWHMSRRHGLDFGLDTPSA